MSKRISIALLSSLAPLRPLLAQGTSTGVPIHSHAELAVGGPFELGLMLLVVGMGAVFLGLMAIYVFLMLLKRASEKRSPMASVTEEGGEAGPQRKFVVTSEMASAIALALYMDLRTFDEGTAEEVTIRKITRPFSPWWNAAKTQVIFDKVEMFRRKY